MELLILVAIIVGLVVIFRKTDKTEPQSWTEYLGELPDFTASQTLIGTTHTGIALDESRKKLCLLQDHEINAVPDESGRIVRSSNATQRSISHRIINYGDLLSVELFEDGASVTKSVRSSQVAGALLGAVAFGGVGAIIGGLSGKTETHAGKVKRIDLRLIVNDTNRPLHDISLLHCEVAVERTGLLYRNAIDKARHWSGLLDVVISRADAENRAGDAQRSGPPSIADELKKLADLRSSGVLTEGEFETAKHRVLSDSAPVVKRV